MKLIVAFGFFGFLSLARGESALVNQKLVQKVEEVEKSALHIKSEDEGLVYLNLHDHSFAAKSQFVFFRRRGTRLQMIAMGTVEGDRENPADHSKELIVNVDKDSIVKYPQVGDLGVPLADPMSSAIGEKRDNSDTATVENPAKGEKPQPGYLEFGMGIMFGQLSSDANPQYGGGKNSHTYRFPNLHFEYFSGVAPVGVGYESHTGNLPTSVHSGAVVNSAETVSHLSFFYRPRPFWNQKVQVIPKVFFLSDALKTDNTGSELFTTTISAVGLGARIQYRFASEVWKPENTRLGAQPLNVFAELGFSPMVTAQDAGPSRGTSSSGSTLLEYRLGATALFWINFIPVLKRWMIQASYGARLYSLSFQGPTVSEAGNPIPVPEGIHTQESEKDYRFFIGVRLGDPIEALFGDSDEKKAEKK